MKLLNHCTVSIKSLFFFLIFIPVLLIAEGIEDAKTYHANSNLQWHVAVETIELVPWMDSYNVLDLGCGDGKITALLAEKVAKGFVLGMDISQSMIDFASSKYPQVEYPNLKFQQHDAAEISFENQFDRVVSFSTLHWVLDQEKALKAIHRALVPGGTICIHTYSKGNMNVTDIGDLLTRTNKWEPYFPNYTKQRVFYTENEYRSLIEQAGFHDIQIFSSQSLTIFPNRQALIQFATPVLNFIRHLPEELQQEFVEEVVDRIIQVAGISKDGSIPYQTFNLQVIGTK
jgi:trans-aconitate 2-methyltransferase